MFFQPPKVKSLSRYAEYGAYLGNRHFLLMLGIAFTLHIAFIAIYSMSPSQDVIRIPVRPLNIKISGGSPNIGLHMPAPEAMPVTKPPVVQPQQEDEEGLKSIGTDSTESAMDSEPKAAERKPVREHPKANPGKGAHTPPPAKKGGHGHAESSMPTPKRYVRAGTAKPQQPAATANVGGEASGNEQIERYTQVISQWIKNHHSAAEQAYKNAVQGQEKVQGQVVVRIRIDREGHILYNSVDHTSGNELVDEAAIAMVRASDPVPSVPGDYPSDSQLEFLIPVAVNFSKQ